MTSQPDKPKRWRPRFSLGEMLVFTTYCAMAVWVNVTPTVTLRELPMQGDYEGFNPYMCERGCPWRWQSLTARTMKALPLTHPTTIDRTALAIDLCFGVMAVFFSSLASLRIARFVVG